MHSLLLLPMAAHAQEFLYAPAPPPGSAFVRVVVASPAVGPVSGSLGPIKVEGAKFGDVTPYRTLPGGDHAIRLGGATKEHGFATGSYSTVVITGKKDAAPVVLADASSRNLAKAQVCLYNLVDAPGADLKTADGALALVSGVAPWSVACREVNPVEAALAAFSGGSRVTAFPAQRLEASAVYGAFLVGAAGAVEGRWVRASTDTGR